VYKTAVLYIVLYLAVSVTAAHGQILQLPVPETWRLSLIAESGGFRELVSVSIDPGGNVYVADRETNLVHKLNRQGFIEQSVGGYGWGNNEFDRPAAVWAENGIDVFVADYGNHRIQRYDRRLSYVGTLETRNTGFEIEQFGYPVGVTMSRQGDLFVLDEENLRIVSFGGLDRHRRTFGGIEAGRFRLGNPSKIAVYGDDLIAVRDGNRLLFFDQFGNPFREFSPEFLGPYKDFTVVDDYIFVLREDAIDVYRGELRRPIERIGLYPYFADPSELSGISAAGNRIVLLNDEQVWMFQLLR
jgi:hypothetical protein